MKIVDARVIVTCPDRTFVTLKIVTDDGVTGVGDTTLTGRELAVAAYLTEHVVLGVDIDEELAGSDLPLSWFTTLSGS